MQRRERDVALKLRQHVLVHQERTGIVRSAMHDAMPDRDRDDGWLLQPSADGVNRVGQVLNLIRRICPVDQRLLISRLGAQPRPRADAVHLALDQAFHRPRRRSQRPGT